MQIHLALPAALGLALLSIQPSIDPAVQSATPRHDSFKLAAGDHAPDQILDAAARFLGRNYMLSLDPRKPPPNIHLQKHLELDATGCEEVVSQLLLSCNVVMTPLDPVRGIYEWVDTQRNNNYSKVLSRAFPMSPDEIRRRVAWKVCVQTTVACEHLSPTLTANSLTQVFARASRPVPFQATAVGGSVVLVGLTDCVERALRILRATDVEGAANQGGADARFGALEARLGGIEGQLRKLATELKKKK